MTKQAGHPQLSLPLSGSPQSHLVRTTRRANKTRAARLTAAIQLQLKERRFLPVAGVPATRAECPTQRPCPHVRCRWHLHLEDAEHRAGRPGLANVPRDPRTGLTVSTPGDMGDERPGTDVSPRWEIYDVKRNKVVQLGRTCSVWVERNEDGTFATLNAFYESEWGAFKQQTHPGEAIDVLVDNVRVGGAKLIVVDADPNEERTAVSLDHQPQWFSAVLQRVRGVDSCALDVIERQGKCSNEQIGDALARHRTLVARELRGAVRKAIEEAEEIGMSAEDLMRALMDMGAAR